MTTEQIAKDFVALLREGKHDEAAGTFNADDIVSYENMPGPMTVCRGKEAVRQKSEWWAANHDVNDFGCEGPYLNGDQFAVLFHVDVTVKATGERQKMDEIGLYTLKGGKVVEERFFY